MNPLFFIKVNRNMDNLKTNIVNVKHNLKFYDNL